MIRTALEAESASGEAGRLTEAAAEAFADNLAAHERAIERRHFAEAIRLDDTFHRMIAEVNGLHMLWRAVDISKAQMDRGRHLAIPKPGLGAVTIREHRQILERCWRATPNARRNACASTWRLAAQHARDRGGFDRMNYAKRYAPVHLSAGSSLGERI